MDLSYSIKELRARHNLTQVQCAKALDVSFNTWNNWEQTPGKIQMKKALEISRLFNVLLDEIEW